MTRVTLENLSMDFGASSGASVRDLSLTFDCGALTAILRRRQAGGGGPLSLLSCDNLRSNGTRLRAGLLDGEERAELTLDPRRLAYVFVARGSLRVNGVALATGDAATLSGEQRLVIDGGQAAEVLVFDLAA